MALTRPEDYHFANVTGIDISGELLPQHPDYWKVNRGEDLAFLLEAYGERLAIMEKIEDYAYRHPSTMMTTSAAEAIVKSRLMVGERWNAPLLVEDIGQQHAILDRLNGRVLGDASLGNWWCNGTPAQKSWSSENFPGWDPCDLFPEIYPSALAPILPSRIQWPLLWTVDLLRAAYADLTARQCCLVPGTDWFNTETHISRFTSSSGESRTLYGWHAGREYVPSDEWSSITIPDPVYRKVVPPELGSGGTVVTIWRAGVAGEGESYHMRVTEPDHSFDEELERYMPESGNGTRYVTGTMIGYIVEATNMRTYL